MFGKGDISSHVDQSTDTGATDHGPRSTLNVLSVFLTLLRSSSTVPSKTFSSLVICPIQFFFLFLYVERAQK